MEEYKVEFSGINATNRMLLWNPGKPEEIILIDPDKESEPNSYTHSSLCCYTDVREMDFEERKKIIYILVAHLIIRDGMDPQKVHATLLPLDEYRDGCAYDMPLISRSAI